MLGAIQKLFGAGGASSPEVEAQHVHHPGQQSFLIVFDFDHTVVDCNTDEVIPRALGRADLVKQLRQEDMQWTTLCDTVIAPFTPKEIRAAAKQSITLDPDMPKVFELFRQLRQRCGPTLMEIHIASDANLLYIDASLEACLPGVRELVSQIHSNYYEEVGDAESRDEPADPVQRSELERDAKYNAGKTRRSRLHWYEGHQCACCIAGKKPNMCKSRILQRILHTTTLIDPTIIFIGDGRNDYCTVQHALRPRDYIFARRDFPLHETLASPEMEWGCCHVKLWKNADELRSHFTQVLTLAPRLPTNVRFRDVGVEEFRAATLTKRVPGIFARHLEANRAHMSAAGIQRLEALIASTRENGSVPLLPGQKSVPSWLQNLALVSECDAAEQVQPLNGKRLTATVAPRWGQMPWLHGEIYMYHLLWQYVMATEEVDQIHRRKRAMQGGVLNQITPYANDNPLFSYDCANMAPNLAAAPTDPRECFDTSFLIRQPLEKGVALGGAGGPKSGVFEDLLPGKADGILPGPLSDYFYPYRDIYAAEKTEVTECFLRQRVVPMIACEPWKALDGARDAAAPAPDALAFLPTLLRWMLWGNGVDLSMFTMEQLASDSKKNNASAATNQENADANNNNNNADPNSGVRHQREVEQQLMQSMESFLVGNETSALQSHIEHIVKNISLTPSRAEALESNHIDIVTDNVGVEIFADLLFALWFTAHSTTQVGGRQAGSVTFHVKPMPYYVSDVTAADFTAQLDLLEKGVLQDTAGAGPDAHTPAEQESVRSFIDRVKAAFASGQFQVESDLVWVQPSEYRDLPPRVVNRYFFKHRLISTQQPGHQTASPTTPHPDLTALYRENKVLVRPRSALVIFKGDLNYRRLIGDRHWCKTDFFVSLARNDPAVLPKLWDKGAAGGVLSPAEKARLEPFLADTMPSYVMDAPSLQEIVSAYWPTQTVAVASIRTIKSECCVGVPGSTKAALDKKEGFGWRLSGKYGLILFAS